MIAYAAIDVRGGRAVQLVGGRPEDERINLPDPVDVAAAWVDAGFKWLHVVDLDAALGTGSNRAVVDRIVAEATVPVQVGGGIREDESARALIDAGAARIVTGTRAIEDEAWLSDLAGRYPGRVVVAADVRGERVVLRGWSAESALAPLDLLGRLDSLPLAAVLVTDVGREGSMRGADVARFASLAGATRHPLIASGGIASVEDLRALSSAGAAGAVLGMALYTGAVDATAIAKEFAA